MLQTMATTAALFDIQQSDIIHCTLAAERSPHVMRETGQAQLLLGPAGAAAGGQDDRKQHAGV
jgi:hypothetical protein